MATRRKASGPRKTASPEVEELRARLDEANETLRAIREGEVDAVIVSGSRGEQVFSLVGSDSIYRLIVETMKEAAFTVTFDGTILYCNARLGEFLSRPIEQIIGRSLHEFVDSANRAAANALLVIAREKPVKQRMVFSAADGHAVPAHISANVLNQPDGLSICVVAADLTELENSTEMIQQLRRQQEALRAANEELAATEGELRVQNDALVASRAELERSNRDLEQFAYVASHDLQEPLRAVSGFLNLLRDRYKDQLDEKAAGFIEHSVEGATRMSALIRGLLEFARVGTRGTHRVSVDLAAVVGEVTADLRAAIDECGAVVAAGSLPILVADKGQMRQLFQNLIANAIKFRHEGRRPVVRVTAEQQPGEWVFRVADNGIGIAPEQWDRVFAIFQRLHGREEYPGTGIGLAICQRIVEGHGGRIWIEPAPGEGSTFCFTLPLRTVD